MILFCVCVYGSCNKCRGIYKCFVHTTFVHCTHYDIIIIVQTTRCKYNNIFDFASLYTVLRLLNYIITDRTSKVIIARVISYVTNISAVNNRELNV